MNSQKFLIEVESHRSRLFLMSQLSQKKLQDLMGWNEVHYSLWDHYLSYHDLPKIQSSSELRTYGYNHQKSLLDRLLPFYGESIYELSAFEKEELVLVIQDLNRVEASQKNDFFMVMGEQLSKFESIRSDFVRLETVLDVIDTTHFRAKEMGSKFLSAAEWFKNNKQTQLVSLAIELENSLSPQFKLLQRV